MNNETIKQTIKLPVIKQVIKQVFLSQRNKEERLSALRGKDFGASRKNLVRLRAKRNHLPAPWTRSFFLVPLYY